MTKQHRYIQESDERIIAAIKREKENIDRELEVVELGCGPARLTEQVVASIKDIRLTSVDHDHEFIHFGTNLFKEQGLNGRFVLGDVVEYRHTSLVGCFFSQGMHHHIPKGEKTALYLEGVWAQLARGGAFILCDEFLRHYTNSRERLEVMVMWYSHIIADGLRHGYKLLAIEEAKTLLDDLVEGQDPDAVKTDEQIELVLESVEMIDDLATIGARKNAHDQAHLFLKRLATLRSTTKNDDPRLELSRGDCKIHGADFRHEVTAAGFVVESVEHLGPIDVAGGFSIYTLRKPA